ncbi:MAG: hypothetical protein ACOX2R_12360 [Anaerolineae bacterium]|jgi:hypothetical protein
MSGSFKLHSQTEAFWRDEYQVTDQDLDLVTSLILDAGKPRSADILAAAIIMRRVKREQQALAQMASRGDLYQPKNTYEVGQRLVFSAREFADGTVTDVREGYNPKYGEFSVIKVQFEDEGPELEFAAGFAYEHALNRPEEELLGGSDEAFSVEDLVATCLPYVRDRLSAALEEHDEFLRFEDEWYLQELLPDVDEGYLNLAEALIYERDQPLSVSDILSALDLAEGTSVAAQSFALNRALASDVRFDDVSLDDQPLWYLRQLEPAAVHMRPPVMDDPIRTEGGESIGLSMLDLVEDLGDELDDVPGMVLRELDQIAYDVTFPHLYAGTMPSTQQLLTALKLEHNDRHARITLMDANSGKAYPVWLVPTQGYVCGLNEWYREVGMCVGGRVEVSIPDEPLTIAVSTQRARRSRSEFIRAAAAEGGTLTLQMQRASLDVEVDRDTVIYIPEPEEIATLMLTDRMRGLSLSEIVYHAFEELAKLGSGGTVHAKSVYSAVNLMRRCGSVPIFQELTRRACYDPVGNNEWVFDPNKKGIYYTTPDDMRERPQSSRDTAVQEPVAQYLGR